MDEPLEDPLAVGLRDPRAWSGDQARTSRRAQTDAAPFMVGIDVASRVPMLAAGKVQSIDQFLMSEPAIRRAVTNAKPVCLFAGDYGLEIYANSIGVAEDFLTKNREAVKKFVRAALKGWKDAPGLIPRKPRASKSNM